jgi:peroxiredoxin Q/BCP
VSTTIQPSRKGAPGRKPAGRSAHAQAQARRRLLVRLGLGAAAASLGLFAIFASRGGGGSGGGGPRFDVGKPGPGVEAPPIRLASTTGGTYDLQADRGKTVLLYFQEGVGCQPCWDQIRDIEKNMEPFKALGIDKMVTITVDDLGRLRQKLADEGLKTPGLSDSELSLGRSYNANQYGMMGTSTYGHTFIVVGPDGRIRWRADYGGKPDYTMYVKPAALLDDMRAGLKGQSGQAGS